MSLLIENIHILTIDHEYGEFESGFIAVDGKDIIDIGSMEDLGCRYRAEKILNGHGKLALPGLINTHTHSAMSLFRGYADDMPLWDWLTKRIWPLEDRLESEDIYYLSMLSMAEMIQSGTTTFSDMYMFMDETAKAAQKVGMRAMLARGLQGYDKLSDIRLKESRELYEAWHGGADGRIKVMIGPHAIYTCCEDFLNQCMDLARELNLPIHMHISETKKEVLDCLEKHGRTPIKYLDDIGLFEIRTLAAHCVHLNEEDIQILGQRDVRVAHCPSSNLKLASGFMPAAKLIRNGIDISLGTDGASSNNNLSIIKEMNLAAIMGKAVAEDASAVSARDVINMATINGARALFMGDEIGSLEPGKRADIILIDLDKPHFKPKNDIDSLLVYSGQGQDVDTVIVDGKILMEARQLSTIDLDRLYIEIDRIKKRVMGVS
ncbi:MAG: amidohydrolase [Clostridiales bacterium]|nr:amidohydrolase [Clostridiales bacterium]